MLNCKGKKVLFIGFWIFLSALISTAHASRTELVIIRDGNVRSGPGAGNEIIGKVSLGDDYWIQETKGSWYRIEYENREGWVSSVLAAADNDSAYVNKLLILKNQSVKDAGKRVAYVNRGEIVKLLKKGSMQHAIEINGTRGFVKTGDTKQLGPSTTDSGMMDKILGQKGMVFDFFYWLDNLGKKNITFMIIHWIIAIGILIIPFILISKLVTWLAYITFLKDKYILFTFWILIIFTVLNIFLFLMTTPPYESIIIASIFCVFWFAQMAYQKEKLHQNRCKKCRKMWATQSKGTVFIGKFFGTTKTTTYQMKNNHQKILNSETKLNTWLEYKDIFECKYCGHRWFATWAKVIDSKEIPTNS
ncbi:MAG: SH3 domain-containing protein [Calditrichaceae bacterium]|nr:SH3 domain-containing protein [Calditrichaceae bacterium]